MIMLLADARDLNNLPRARKLGRVAGRNVSKFHALVRVNDSLRCQTVKRFTTTAKAHTAREAAAMIHADLNLPEVEVYVLGPRGGVTESFWGWERWVAHNMLEVGSGDMHKQTDLLA